MNKSFFITILPLVAAFAAFSVGNYVAGKFFNFKAYSFAIICANNILFWTCLIVILINKKATANPNPNAAIRGVMLSMLLKLIVLATAAVVYIQNNHPKNAVPLLGIWLLMYVVYTYIEVKSSIKKQK